MYIKYKMIVLKIKIKWLKLIILTCMDPKRWLQVLDIHLVPKLHIPSGYKRNPILVWKRASQLTTSLRWTKAVTFSCSGSLHNCSCLYSPLWTFCNRLFPLYPCWMFAQITFHIESDCFRIILLRLKKKMKKAYF